MSTSFSFGMMYVTRYEQQGVGLQWNNVWESPLGGDTNNFGISLMLLLTDAVLYSAVAIAILAYQCKPRNEKN